MSRNNRSHEGKNNLFTKVVIRRLPPTINMETFLFQISPAPDYNYTYLAKGDANMGTNCFSRVYINFVNPYDVFEFKERFDNYVFLDTKGYKYPAVVEYASFQKIPKRRQRSRGDPKCGTIESDPAYQEFEKMINKPIEYEEKQEYTLQFTPENKNEPTTPLLEYIKNKRAERRRYWESYREERKRRELEKKKERDDERNRNIDEKSIKTIVIKPQGKFTKEEKVTEEEVDSDTDKAEHFEGRSAKPYDRSPYYRNKDKKYDDSKKDKPKFKMYPERRDYKRSDDRGYGNKSDYNKNQKYCYKKDNYEGYRPYRLDEVPWVESKPFSKKVRKYSEKREERKKAEQRKLELAEKKKKEKLTLLKSSDKIEVVNNSTQESNKISEKPEEQKVEKNETGQGANLNTDQQPPTIYKQENLNVNSK